MEELLQQLAYCSERSSPPLPSWQVSLEGGISRGSVIKCLSRGKRASGDLIPWTISQQFADSNFASLSGARVVRIAVHPDLQVLGPGAWLYETCHSAQPLFCYPSLSVELQY